MYLIFALPVVVCLCVAAIQAIRRHWKNMSLALLSGVVILQFTWLFLEANKNVNLRAQNNYLSNKAADLEQKLNKNESNQASEAIGAQSAPQPQH